MKCFKDKASENSSLKVNRYKKSPRKSRKNPQNDEAVYQLSTGKIAARVAICVATFLIILVAGILSAVAMVHYGPSKSARNTFTATVTETSAMKFLATWFLPKATIDEIIGDVTLSEPVTTIDTDLVDIPDPEDPEAPAIDKNSLEIIDIDGRSFTGKLMIIQDPTRVTIGTPLAGYGKDKKGVKTIDMVNNENAIAGINGGGFDDFSGQGNGGVPYGLKESGIVISQGKLLWGEASRSYEIIGLNSKGVLVLGKMTAQKALDNDIVEALNFGPYLVMNGEPYSIVNKIESGLNPRSAIGQRKDGAILLLVINGRQSNSLGATYEDLIEIMMKYEAVNAANLDGGSSSYMVHEGEIITTCASLYGPRPMATSILVSRVKE